MDQPNSLFDQYFSRNRGRWVTLLVCLSMIFLPFLIAFLKGELEIIFSQGIWRGILLPPTVIIYIWLVSPLISRSGDQVVEAIKSLSILEGDDFDQMVQEVSQVNPTHEWLAIGIGITLGIVSFLTSESEQGITWLTIYWLLSICLMYAVLALTILISVTSTRMNAALHRQPLHIDILNPIQFEAVGRQSLLLALVFIGGITLSLLFTFQDANISSPEFWITNILFVFFTMLIFFLSMRPTHLLLVNEKKRVLEPVQAMIDRKCRTLVLRLDQDQDSGELPAEINALIAYEQRLLAARTWPYNVTILRTLFFSVFLPLGSVLARLAADFFFP